MPIVNIQSVLTHGILSHEACSKLSHADVSLADVQDKRDKKQVPGGLMLHQYSNLYFDARNPMMFKRRMYAQQLCVLRVSTDVLQLQGTVITDQNAASNYVRFLAPNYLNFLDFDMIFAEDWRHPGDQIAQWRHSSRKAAEVLVPGCIETKYILGAYVLNSISENNMRNQGFTQPIEILPKIFFY